jgi:hypothetical protein
MSFGIETVKNREGMRLMNALGGTYPRLDWRGLGKQDVRSLAKPSPLYIIDSWLPCPASPPSFLVVSIPEIFGVIFSPGNGIWHSGNDYPDFRQSGRI